MKVIFLDIDGVLWTLQDQMNWRNLDTNNDDWRGFCPVACRNLNYILMEDPEVHIVISSTWRMGHSPEEMQEILRNNGVSLAKVIDSTPIFRDGPRGNEIKDWLDKHPEVTEYVILDDDSDMLEEQKPRFIRTCTVLGLTLFDAVKAQVLFGNENHKGVLQFERKS